MTGATKLHTRVWLLISKNKKQTTRNYTTSEIGERFPKLLKLAQQKMGF